LEDDRGPKKKVPREHKGLDFLPFTAAAKKTGGKRKKEKGKGR